MVSTGSKAALLELALEETGKAAILCLRVFVHRREEDAPPLLSPEGELLKRALLEIATPGERERIRAAYDLGPFVAEFPLDDLFTGHRPKLAAVAKLAKIVRVSMKVVKSHPEAFMDMIAATPKLRKRLTNLSRVPEADFEKLREFSDPDYLLSLREEGLYVGLDDRRTATLSPRARPEEIRRLQGALRAATGLVEGWMLAHRELIR